MRDLTVDLRFSRHFGKPTIQLSSDNFLKNTQNGTTLLQFILVEKFTRFNLKSSLWHLTQLARAVRIRKQSLTTSADRDSPTSSSKTE
jgi:hypothetical protein